MSAENCPDIERLFIGVDEGDETIFAHVESCPSCAEVLESHRQLEKDLLRLADPLPPADFVHQVMAKVEKAPVPVRREVWTGLGIFAAALAGVIGIVVTDSATAGALGTAVASAIIQLGSVFAALGHGISTIWSTAALPVTAVASFMFMFSLLGLRRMYGGPQEARVSR